MRTWVAFPKLQDKPFESVESLGKGNRAAQWRGVQAKASRQGDSQNINGEERREAANTDMPNDANAASRKIQFPV